MNGYEVFGLVAGFAIYAFLIGYMAKLRSCSEDRPYKYTQPTCKVPMWTVKTPSKSPKETNGR